MVTDDSEERIAYIFRAERLKDGGNMLLINIYNSLPDYNLSYIAT
jgi:hypothetical protein